MSKFLLVDGNLLLFKSFYAAYAINKEPKNLPTHFFFNSLLEAIKSQDATHVFVAFDAHAKTKRHEIYANYKAGRILPPPIIYEQKKIIIQILEAMNIKWLEKAGDEADDLIATIATKFGHENEIIIFSEDKDLLQLVNENISILVKDKKTKQFTLINNNNFFQNHGILPYQIPDYKGIAGDSSDNLKGVLGIGDKTAKELLNRYSTLESIYENLEELTLSKKEKFINSREEAFLCKSLATLNKLVLIPFSKNDLSFDLMKIKAQKSIHIVDSFGLNKIKSLIIDW